MDERARRIERRLEWPMPFAALLTIPAIAIEQTDTGEPWGTIATWDGVWWAITTVTTVGYGDLAPDADAGRVVAIVVMLVGIGFIAALTAAAAGRFLRGQRAEAIALEVVEQRLDEVLRRLDALGPAGRE